MEKDLIKRRSLNPNKRSKTWQLLFVDDHGKMISFSWLKTAAILIVAGLVFSLVCTLVLLALYHDSRKENIRLKEKLEASGKSIKNLRYEMDMLLAKLVLAESKMGPDQDDADTEEEDQKLPAKEIKPAITIKKAVVPDQEAETETNKESVPKTILGIDNFKINQEPGTPDLLKISFKIRNIDQSVKTASGYIFIILKQDENDQDSWFSVPSTDLQEGYPVNARQGQFFRISRFKTVYFRARNQIALDQLKVASVFVFDNQGKRIFEKNFPIPKQKEVLDKHPEDTQPNQSTDPVTEKKVPKNPENGD